MMLRDQTELVVRVFFLVTSLCSGTLGIHAETIQCIYTEPFITTIYSSESGTLKIMDDLNHSEIASRAVSLQIIKPTVFELWNSKNEVVQRMELNFHGSDGMSDTVYPYDATLVDKKGLKGGCTSDHLR
jgi:uncharacterized membrane protein